jgi:dTMP kinase
MAGAFVTFEGIDGCGKSTQLALAAEALRADGVEVDVTREPGGTAISEKIRELVMSAEHEEMSGGCEVLLYLAARAQHVAERIVPAMASGKVVLCDRFQDATFAYQGFGRGLALDELRRMNGYATGGVEPTLTLVFDISVELSRERLAATGKAPDRLESGSAEFFGRIREGYLALAATHPDRFVLLRGDRSVEQIAAEVIAAVRERVCGRE